jgi:hypothetical protein
MARLRRETRRFKRQAIGSLTLAIELFNRPHNTCRTEAVLILLQHAFEMLLEAAIYEKRHTVHEPRSSMTHRFDKCLAITRSDLGILTDNMVISLTILDRYRDCAMHHLIELSEQGLYLQSQAAVTLFDDILQRAFGERVADYLAERVLPVSTNPPQEILIFMDAEFGQINDLISPGRRRLAEAKCRLRPYLIMESVLQGKSEQPTNSEVFKVIKRMRGNEDWQRIFPGIASLKLDTSGYGLTYSIRISREIDAPPVRIVHEGEDAAGATIIREVNLLDRYSMGLWDLADKLGIGRNKIRAIVHYLGLQKDPEYFKEFCHKSIRYKGYTPKALEKIKEALPVIDVEQMWQDYKFLRREAKRSTSSQ